MLKKLVSISSIIILMLFFIGCDILMDVDAIVKENNIKIISLSSNQTEILIALGLEENIIALNSFDKFLTEDKEVIGDISGLDIDRIMELKPDLIVDYEDEFIKDFEDLSLDYISFSPKTIDSIKDNILKLGEHTDEINNAKNLVEDIDTEMKRIKDSLPGEGKDIVVEVWHDPLTLAEAGSYIDELIIFLGCKLTENIAESDFYIAIKNFPEKTINNNMFLLDKNLTIPGINVIDALKELYSIIYQR